MTVDFEYLHELFWSCLNAEYMHTDKDGSYSFVKDGELLYLFFEKSNGVEDWINNLSFGTASIGRGADNWLCHEGFLAVFKSILPYVENAVLSQTVRKIVTVGYSHGAALALLMHEYIWRKRRDIIDSCESYGFGCPRVIFGTVPQEGERWRNFYIIRNIDDIVTHLPPRALGFRHVGRILEIGGRGKYSPIDAHRQENYLLELDNAYKRAK